MVVLKKSNPRAGCPRVTDDPRGLLLLGRLEFLDDLLGIVVEGIAAAGAADVVGLALEHDGRGAQAARHAADVLLAAAGERLALAAAGDLEVLGEQCALLLVEPI